MAGIWPGFSCGGYAVDALRSCYRGWFRLWADGPAIPGRYFFLDEDTPCLPWGHLVGSRNWTTRERGEGWLGEIPGTEQTWENGRFPWPLPPAVAVGTPDQFVRPGPGPLPELGTSYGIDRLCWVLAGEPPPPPD